MTEARGWKLAAFAQVVRSPPYAEVMICKTVGLAYVGSNPTTATTHSPRSAKVTKIIWCAQGNGPRHRRRGLLPRLSEAARITEGLLICSNVIRCRSGRPSPSGLVPHLRPSAELARNSIWP